MKLFGLAQVRMTDGRGGKWQNVDHSNVYVSAIGGGQKTFSLKQHVMFVKLTRYVLPDGWIRHWNAIQT